MDMTLKSFIFSITIGATSVANAQTYLCLADSATTDKHIRQVKYEQRMAKFQNRWAKIIPNKLVGQYAGNIGMMSFGFGWDYGKHDQWETFLIAGYLPKQGLHDHYFTFTAKEIYTPWTIDLCKNKNSQKVWKNLSVQPFFATFFINTILSDEFWVHEPDRYPKGYYGFSTKMRFNLGVGQKMTLKVPSNKLRWFDSVSVYYEVSTNELYIRQKILNSNIPFNDIFCLGIGVQYKIL